ncbi:MAG: PQQ-binding-like beta-propeller repeat protein [Candidatus Aenigmatarchaeota archaeon]
MKYKYLAVPLLVFLLLSFFGAVYTDSITGLFLDQETTTLDLNDYSFEYRLTNFNDTQRTKEFDFNQSRVNKTIWTRLPKNSTLISAKLNASGKISTIYEHFLASATIKGLSIGDITGDSDNEVVTGSGGNVNEPNMYAVNGSTGEVIWTYNVSSPSSETRGTAIGDVDSDGENEVVAGSEDGKVYLLEDVGSEEPRIEDSFDTEASEGVYSVDIPDLEEETVVLVGASDGNVYFLNSSLGQVNNFTIDTGAVYDVTTGNVTSDSGEEIAVGGDKLYLLNQTGSLVWEKDLDTDIRGVDIGNVSSDPGNELTIGGTDNNAYLLNANDTGAEVSWKYSCSDDVFSVSIGNVMLESPYGSNNEVVAGSLDGRIRTLSKDGDLIWGFKARSEVQTSGIGDLTEDMGLEVAAGDGRLYVFNFNYFPTNLSVDVGESGSYQWKDTGKLRGTKTIGGDDFEQVIQAYLDDCSPDESGNCDVPLLFHSDFKGRLNVSDIDFNYSYNTSDLITKKKVESWSRTNNVHVNKSVGNESIKLSFQEHPANDVLIEDIKLNGTSSRCDFNETQYQSVGSDGENLCPVSDFTLSSDSGKELPDSVLFWEDGKLPSDIPVKINESEPWSRQEPEDYTWGKNLTIWGTDETVTFTNVTANVTLNDTEIVEDEFLKVYWDGSWEEITPNTTSTCTDENVNYSEISLGSNSFYVCMEDTDGSGAADFFKWKQPETSSTDYIAGGLTNYRPALENFTVSSQEDYWSENFTFSVDVEDKDDDDVNVTLFVEPNQSSVWEEKGTVEVSGGSGEATFDVSSDMDWAGLNRYKFEYFDHDAEGEKIHSPENTSDISGPTGERHPVEIIHGKGNNSKVNRSESVEFEVGVNDTYLAEIVGDSVDVGFWVTQIGETWTDRQPATTDADGNVSIAFEPDGNYSVGEQNWKAGTHGDEHYKDVNSSNFSVFVYGLLSVNFTEPLSGAQVVRDTEERIAAQLVDGYNDSAGVKEYNCTFEIGSDLIDSNTTNSSGACSYTWQVPSCNLDRGEDDMKVQLGTTQNSEDSEFYIMEDEIDSKSVEVWDALDVAVTGPSEGSLHYSNESINLESDVNDSCVKSSDDHPSDANVSWDLYYDRLLKLDLTEDEGFTRNNELYLLEGAYLDDLGINLDTLETDKTNVFHEGEALPVDVVNDDSGVITKGSKVIFPINVSSEGTEHYTVTWNKSSVNQKEYEFIRDGGFEGGDAERWDYNNNSYDYTDYEDSHSVWNEGEEENYSLHMMADNNNEDEVYLNQSFPDYFSGNVTMVYKAWGNYSDASSVKIISDDNEVCELPLDMNGLTEDEAEWNDTVCEVSPTERLSIEVYSDTDFTGDIEKEPSHILIDYICLGDKAGDCGYRHSGGGFSPKADYSEKIAKSVNYEWDNEDSEKGSRRISPTGFGDYYYNDTDFLDLRIHGWAEVSEVNITSDYCRYNGTDWICGVSSDISSVCWIDDKYSGEPVFGHSVNFYNDTSQLGISETDESGKSSFGFVGPDEIGKYNLTCNITDDPSAFYNSSSIDEKNISFLVKSGSTNGSVELDPKYTETGNITRLDNHTFELVVTLKNTGNGNMMDPQFDYDKPEGVYIPEASCDPLGPGSNCSNTLQVNVTREAPLGVNEVNTTASWSNEDGTTNSTSNITDINVSENTQLDILQSEVSGTFSAGFEGNLANFTMDAFGNTELDNVTFDVSGQNSTTLGNWTVFDPENVTEVPKASNRTVLINGTVPTDAESGYYLANITANATGSVCEPLEKCWDKTLFNLTVDVPDWYREPETTNKTIGSGQGYEPIDEIKISNNLADNQTFEVSVNGNGTDYIHADTNLLEVSNKSSQTFEVFHNTTEEEYDVGFYTANVTVSSLNTSSPEELITSVGLDVVPLTAEIKGLDDEHYEPKGHAGPLNASDEIKMWVNVTKPGEVIDENVTFDVEVSGQEVSFIEGPEWRGEEYDIKGWYMAFRAPELEDNPVVNPVRVDAKYETEGISTVAERKGSVVYYDIKPPSFSEVKVDPVMKEVVEEEGQVEIETDVFDNTGVDNVWMNITVNETGDTTRIDGTKSGDIWAFDYGGVNGSFPVSDYDITLSTNDTGDIEDAEGSENIDIPSDDSDYWNSYGGQVNSTTGWFSVYEPMNVSIDTSDPSGKSMPVNLTWYRPGRKDIVVHSWSEVTDVEKEIHRRKYDLRAELFDQEVQYNKFDTNQSLLQQGDADSLGKPFRLDYFPNSSCDHCDAIRILPGEFREPLFGLVVEENSTMEFTSKEVTLDYSDKSLGSVYRTGNLRVLECSDWSYGSRTCNTSLTGEDMIEAKPDTSERTLTFETQNGSGYILAEACLSDGELIDCTGYTPTEDSTDDSESSGGVEPPEEEEPFPFDFETNIEDEKVFPGESKDRWIMLTNNLEEEIEVNLSMFGDLDEWYTFESGTVELGPTGSKTVSVDLEVPEDVQPDTYSDALVLRSRGRERTRPVQLEVLEPGEEELSMDLELIESRIESGDNLTARIELKGQDANDRFEVNLTYVARDQDNKTSFEHKNFVTFEETYSDLKEIKTSEDMDAGTYRLYVWAEFNGKAVKDMATFQVTQPFWATTAGQIIIFLGVPIAVIVILIGVFRLREKYKVWKEEKEEQQRYLFPVDYSAIPQKSEDSFWIGKLAGKNKKAYYNPDDLKTHVLVAGATGAGKSVGASVFAEEALDSDVPVVVFDPTAQWTGFVNSCEDEDLLKYYNKLGMDKKRRKSYPGMIHKMDDPEREIDFKELMNEGEITVFTLHDLTTSEFDQAVRNIIDSMFDVNWEESEDLKLVVVFDEVHRLLEKYGGKGGYEALERACREFRKWGIGIIMCSQVLSDFKEAIEGNVLTDVQFNTKATQDIQKAKDKYGEKYAKRITRQGIGVCMMQNPQYNDGDPWFVRFRPTWHNPHKLEEEKLEKYEDYSEKLKEIEEKIDSMEDKGKDVFDLRTSLRMAKNKLKSGNFRMTEIYIDSLEEKIK